MPVDTFSIGSANSDIRYTPYQGLPSESRAESGQPFGEYLVSTYKLAIPAVTAGDYRVISIQAQLPFTYRYTFLDGGVRLGGDLSANFGGSGVVTVMYGDLEHICQFPISVSTVHAVESGAHVINRTYQIPWHDVPGLLAGSGGLFGTNTTIPLQIDLTDSAISCPAITATLWLRFQAFGIDQAIWADPNRSTLVR